MEKASAKVMASRAERLKKARVSIGKSQKQLSRELRLGDSTWQNYELKKSFPNVNILDKLERMYDIDRNWLLDGTGEMKKSLRAEKAYAVMEAPAFGMSGAGSVNGRKLFDMAFAALYESAGRKNSTPGETAGRAFRITEKILMSARTESEAVEMLELIIDEEAAGK